jgi:hypothetical protein
MTPERELTTADLARTSEELRGRSDEQIVARRSEPIGDAPKDVLPQNARRDQPREPARDKEVRAEVANQRTQDVAAHTALFAANEATQLRERWSDVQAGFVDEPRSAVERADSLVAEVMKKLAEGFASERSTLEHQWDRGDNVTTEDLRIALQRYRSFFDRLLRV